MPRYLISFDDGAMDHIPEEEMNDVGEAAHAVIRDAQAAGVWVFAGGVFPHDEVSVRVVAPDGTVTDSVESKAYIAGVTIVDVPSLEEALEWAAKIAAACRCAQEVREFGPDRALGNGRAGRPDSVLSHAVDAACFACALELELSAVVEAQARSCDEVARRRGDEYFAPVGEGGDARGDVDGDSARRSRRRAHDFSGVEA